MIWQYDVSIQARVEGLHMPRSTQNAQISGVAGLAHSSSVPVLVCAPVKVTATVVPQSPPLAFPNDMLLMGPTVHPLLIVVLL